MTKLPGDLRNYFTKLGDQIVERGLIKITTTATEDVLFRELVRRKLLTYNGKEPSMDRDKATVYYSVNFAYAGKELYTDLTGYL